MTTSKDIAKVCLEQLDDGDRLARAQGASIREYIVELESENAELRKVLAEIQAAADEAVGIMDLTCLFGTGGECARIIMNNDFTTLEVLIRIISTRAKLAVEDKRGEAKSDEN